MTETLSLGSLANGVQVLAERGAAGWGIAVRGPGRLHAAQPEPVQAEVWTTEVARYACGYAEVEQQESALTGRARLSLGAGAALVVEDRWTIQGEALRLARRVRVAGQAPGGFLTAFTLVPELPLQWPDVDAFAPGMIYGWTEHIARHAIGSIAHYVQGVRSVRIREDRLPAPLFGIALRDGTTLTVLDPAPRGDTTRDDGLDMEGEPLVDERFAFAALGGAERDGRLEVGFWFPGAEGEVTYTANTPFRDGEFGWNSRRRWRGRYHPIRDGFEQRYDVAFRFGTGERDQDFRRESWRWAWRTLAPEVVPHDIELVRETVAAMLEGSIRQVEDRAGPIHVIDAATGVSRDRPVVMGFTGRAVESAELLLRETRGLDAAAAARRRERALTILETFARLPVNPAQAEGLSLETGQPTSGVRPDFFLRALAEGGKYMLRAWQAERTQGVEHPHWLRWCVDLADWLLTQEFATGGFPRAWRDRTAEVTKPDPRSSYAVVPFFTALTGATGDDKYLVAALRAAELCWALDGSRGYFIGGTLDNANVVDKEAGTLTLEAHLALFEATGDGRWIGRARDAADFAETWMYLWNVPMPADVADAELHWKHGVSTVGVQLIATGHSLVDAYMAWDVANYARLYRHTGDAHYLQVAQILLHNTKVMLALPGRPFDLLGPGFQQEHWSMAPLRGHGVHRGWLPWVACSHLEGIAALEELDPELFAALAKSEALSGVST